MDKYDLSGRRAAIIIRGGGRPGDEYDVERVTKICQQNSFPEFGDWISFSTKKELIDALKSFRDKLDGDTGMLMVTIMAHGTLGHIEVNDVENLELEEIYQLFNNRQCPALREKPKLFLVQACRNVKGHSKNPNTDGSVQHSPLQKKLLPTLSDSMEVYAVFPDKFAGRRPDKGSPLFEEMEKVFNQDSVSKHHMYELFTKVNERLGQRTYAKGEYECDHAILSERLSKLQLQSQILSDNVDNDSKIGRSLHIVSSLTKKLYL
ncbi:hypothetical protein UPYG_G00048300 [Umbra pygmaea]|uniref:Caspase-14-like n=1 Tax=Umbra pygmaea TaxID=75934 RepID=A0ABD0XRB1_UMBPY